MNQCLKPSGWLGSLVIRAMNRRHGPVTDWGLSHVTIRASDTVLDVGCGGGRTVGKLAARASTGRVYGVDYAEASVRASTRENEQFVRDGRVEIQRASVSHLPFPDDTFDLVTAVETHFWWPDLPRDLLEVRRVMNPGGRIAIIAEFYDGGKHAKYAARLASTTGIASLTIDAHRTLLERAGFTSLEVIEEPAHGWLCALGTK